MALDTRIDPRTFRSALGHFATGVTVITTKTDGQVHGMTANAFMSVSLDPPLVLVSVDHRATLHKLLPESMRYGISILAHDQEALSDHFARRHVEGVKFSFVEKYGVPVLDGAVAQMVARVVDMHPAGDHTLYIGQLEYLEWREDKPLLFYAGKYGQLETERAKPAAPGRDEVSPFWSGDSNETRKKKEPSSKPDVTRRET